MTEWEGKNLLCFGDNLDSLSDHDLFPDECVDLIYLDPPFNSQQSYNVLFKEATGTPAAAQIKAFEDTWTWDMSANEAVTRIHHDRGVPEPVVELMKTFMNFLKASPMMAYLVQMAIRLVHMHRVLKKTGSLYLHCDPTASHYLKLILDAAFDPRNFVNEIVWRRTTAHSNVYRAYGDITDTIFFYTKTPSYAWNQVYKALPTEELERRFPKLDPDGRRWRSENLRNPGKRPNLYYPYTASNGVTYLPHPNGWTCSIERMRELDRQGRLHFPAKPGGRLRLKLYADEFPGVKLQNLWDDISAIGSRAAERMGYPTQKPLQLLNRIIRVSSNPGGVVMDPFCGCGTTIDAVETVNRENPNEAPRTWIGIDITHLSINLIKHRLMRFTPPPEYEVIGEPASASGTAALAQHDPFQFQFWALGLIGARPTGGKKKRGPDTGIDGVRVFVDEMKGKQPVIKRMLVQVKSGKVGAKEVRDFVGTLTREKAELGAFLTLQEPTKPMRTEAAAAGTYPSPWNGQAYPRVQMLTIEELLADPHRPNPRCLQIPGGSAQHTLPEAPKHNPKRRGTPTLWEHET